MSSKPPPRKQRLRILFDILPSPVAEWQGPDALDSVLNFPMYEAIRDAYTIPGPNNITQLERVFAEVKEKFHASGHSGIGEFAAYRSYVGYHLAWQLRGKPRRSALAQLVCRPAESLVSY